MIKIVPRILILILLNMNHNDCIAQANLSDSSYDLNSSLSKSFISIYSPIDSVRIYIDSIYFGVAPKESIKVSDGRHVLRFIHPENHDWYHPAVIETVQLKTDEHILVNVEFQNICRIATVPFNAELTIGDSVYGTTPYLLPMSAGNLCVSVSKEGFESITENLDSRLGQFRFNLVRSDRSTLSHESTYLASINEKGQTPIYLSAGATVLAGAAAAYFKIKADNRYSDYKLTGDRATLDRVKSLDTAAGVSLFVAEMSLILFSYLLISR